MTAILPLTLSGATVRKRGKQLLGPIDLTLQAGGLTAIIGPNGSGKTTLLRLMHGLERARDGAVAWAAPDDIARTRQAFVFQTPIMMRRSVLDCIAYPLTLSGARRADARRTALDAAAQAGLSDVVDLPAQMISGGERQKLALARALIRAPEVLFLDEPCASLDGRATREIETRLGAARSENVTLVMSTHDVAQARRLADAIIFMNRGTILAHCPAAEFFAAPGSEEASALLEGRIIE